MWVQWHLGLAVSRLPQRMIFFSVITQTDMKIISVHTVLRKISVLEQTSRHALRSTFSFKSLHRNLYMARAPPLKKQNGNGNPCQLGRRTRAARASQNLRCPGMTRCCQPVLPLPADAHKSAAMPPT